jgi:hypothetical protein
METDNFKGYYVKINGCTFQNPSIKRETFKFAPKLVQVTDAGVLASGRLNIKVLPHTRAKIWMGFPPMTPSQFRTYWNALLGDESGVGMYLSVEVWDESTNSYVTDTFYHNDLQYKNVNYEGRRMVVMDDFQLIGH